jgi:hypothetical protein
MSPIHPSHLRQVVHLKVEIRSGSTTAADVGIGVEWICSVLLFDGDLHLFLQITWKMQSTWVPMDNFQKKIPSQK